MTDPLGDREFASLMMSCVGQTPPSHIAVAVSGGADSMALTVLLKTWGKSLNILVTALTVDHGLRTGSADEAVHVKKWLLNLGLKHHILTWLPAKDIRTGVQARARKARYELMGDWCRAHGINSLFLAHHLDDQAETVLMRLKKQSTLYGFGAMAPVRDDAGVNLCRPLLNVPKSRLIATLKAVGQDWVEDPSNQNLDFERVRVRALLKTLANEGLSAKALGKAAHSARVVCGVLDTAADRLLEAEVVEDEKGGLILNAAFFTAPRRVLERALSKLLMNVGGGVYPPSPDKLQRLLTWLDTSQTGARTLAGVLLRVTALGVRLSAELPRQNCEKAGK